MSKNRGLFKLTDDYLYIANDGHSFDRLGVLALCLPNLSTKDKGEVIDKHKDVGDKKWINATNESQLQQYKDYPNRLETDFKEEISTAKDYSGRWIF